MARHSYQSPFPLFQDRAIIIILFIVAVVQFCCICWQSLTPCIRCGKDDIFSPLAGREIDYPSLHHQSRTVFGYESPLPSWPPPKNSTSKFFVINLFPMRIEMQKQLWRTFIEMRFVNSSHQSLLQSSLVMYPDLDRTILYCFLRHFRPKKVVEIGSGESTHVAQQALKDNGMDVQHIVIEPYRSTSVPSGIKTIIEEVQQLDFDIYDNLEKNDVLFIDSSHVIMPYGDTLTELVTILPRLNPGVLVHFHDIYLPDDYPPNWFNKNMVYTEQWAIALMLYGAETEWEVVWSSYLMSSRFPEFILKMNSYPLRPNQTKPIGGSLWIRKLGASRRMSVA